MPHRRLQHHSLAPTPTRTRRWGSGDARVVVPSYKVPNGNSGRQRWRHARHRKLKLDLFLCKAYAIEFVSFEGESNRIQKASVSHTYMPHTLYICALAGLSSGGLSSRAPSRAVGQQPMPAPAWMPQAGLPIDDVYWANYDVVRLQITRIVQNSGALDESGV